MTDNDMHQEIKTEPVVRFLRLFCGDDIIAWVSDIESGYYLEEPVVVLVDLDPEQEKQTCVFMPWLPKGIVSSNDCTLKEEDVLFFKKVEPDIEAYYKHMCIEALKYKPKLLQVKKPDKNQEKNVFGFSLDKVRPLKGIQHEQKEEKANT